MHKLNLSPTELISYHLNKITKENNKLKIINIFLNIIIIISGFASTVITSIVLSKIIFNRPPDWYYYGTAGLSAIISLSMSFLNFFIVKKRIISNENIINEINAEYVSFNSKSKNVYSSQNENKNNYFLALNILYITGSKIAKKELKYDRK